MGVDIFFVLSGFLISSLLVSEYDRFGKVSLKKFYMRRVLRLGPALIALLIVFCIASFVLLDEKKATSNYVDALISLAYLSNWARAFSIHPPDFLGHTWSLSIEEQFYIIWPIVLLTLLRVFKNRNYVLVIAAAIALFSWFLRIYLLSNAVGPARLYNGLDTRADTLMIGCMLGVALSSGLVNDNAMKRLNTYFVFVAPLSMVCLLAFSVFSHWRASYMYYWGFFVIGFLTVILILDILTNPQSNIKKFFGMRWLVWVGSISYGLYLWHYPIISSNVCLGI
ncbi:MAG: acyltransferase family protein [Sulfuriferula sp.]